MASHPVSYYTGIWSARSLKRALEQRVSRLEGAYEQVDRRLDELSRSIESLRTEMNGLRAEMNNRFNNVYVLIGGSWVTIMVAIIGLYIKG